MRPDPGSSHRHKRATIVSAVVSISALVAAILHTLAPDAKIDSVFLALLLVAAIPWLGDILESIDLPGGGAVRWRERIETLEARTELVETKTDRVAESVDDAVEQAEDARGAFAAGADSQDPVQDDVRDPVEGLRGLASDYNHVRATRRAGFERTSAMTAIVREMEVIARNTDLFDWRSALESPDRGMRLAGYTYLRTRPQRGAAEPLVATLLREDKPFGQYWALKSLRAVAEEDSDVARFEPKLKEFQRHLEPHTDRAREIAKLLKEIDSRRPRVAR
jgi:hypothetical protein